MHASQALPQLKRPRRRMPQPAALGRAWIDRARSRVACRRTTASKWDRDGRWNGISERPPTAVTSREAARRSRAGHAHAHRHPRHPARPASQPRADSPNGSPQRSAPPPSQGYVGGGSSVRDHGAVLAVSCLAVEAAAHPLAQAALSGAPRGGAAAQRSFGARPPGAAGSHSPPSFVGVGPAGSVGLDRPNLAAPIAVPTSSAPLHARNPRFGARQYSRLRSGGAARVPCGTDRAPSIPRRPEPL